MTCGRKLYEVVGDMELGRDGVSRLGVPRRWGFGNALDRMLVEDENKLWRLAESDLRSSMWP